MFANKKIFVAGGRSGFLGTNIAKVLLQKGATVYAHSRSPHTPSHFKKGTLNCFELTEDLSRSCTLPEGVDYVFHCAAHTSGAHEMVNNPVAQVIPNLFMNSLLLDAAAKSKVKKFLFISSSAVYPEVEGPITEEMAFVDDPPETYFGPAWMKRYTEKIAEFYFKRCGMEIVIIRPSNVYGPYCSFDLERAHVLPALIRKFAEKQDPIEVWGTPNVMRDFIYADDFVLGVLTAFEKSSPFSVFNIASGEQVTIGEAVEIIKDLTQYKGKSTFNVSKPMTVGQRMIDTTKAKEILGFQATTTFREGLKKTIDWYMSECSQ
jgi:GDP-L-fucose synthase